MFTLVSCLQNFIDKDTKFSYCFMARNGAFLVGRLRMHKTEIMLQGQCRQVAGAEGGHVRRPALPAHDRGGAGGF